MESIAISRLHWKELRTQGVIWIALFAMCAMFAVAVIVLVDPDNLAIAMDSLVFVGPALFALACGSFAFASEDETGTIGVLRRLPINSRDVLRAKLGFGLIGLLLFYGLFAAVVWITGFQLRPRLVSAPGHFHYAFWGVEALFWSAFFSMRTRSSFASAAWAAVSVGMITYLFELFIAGGLAWQIAAFTLRILAIGYVATRLVPQSDEWFHDFEVQSKPNALSWMLERLHRIPRDIGRTLWLTWRENRTLIIICLGAIGFLFLAVNYLSVRSRFEYLEKLARNDFGQYDQRYGAALRLPPYFSVILFCTFLLDLLFAATGLVIFGTFRQLRSLPMLVHQGISARFMSIVRIALFVAILLFTWSALFAAYHNSAGRSSSFDGQELFRLAFLVPGWCFVGTLWSSFHTKKKVVAYFAGISLGIAAAVINFAFTRYQISPTFWGYSLFVWLSLSLVVYTVFFANQWARQSWGRFRRMASWCLMPLALVGIYGGTATYRIYDVPDISNLTLDIPKPKDVPKCETIFTASMFDLKELFGDKISDPELAALFYRGGVFSHPYINHDEFKTWLSTDSSSLKWRAANLDRVDLIYECFLALEPQIQGVRDTLLSKDCVVFVSSGTGTDRDEDNWMMFAAYAKLKESKPSESLAYINAMIRWAQNNRRYGYQNQNSLSPGLASGKMRVIGGSISEEWALQMLVTWALQPSVAAQPDLIREAIHLIPKPGTDRELITYGIVWSRDWQKSNPIDDAAFYNYAYPVDRQIRAISRMLVPWEAQRRRVLIDHAAYLAYQLRNRPDVNTQVKVQAEFRRYGSGHYGFLNVNFDALDEARVATMEKLEKALATALEPKK